MELEIPRGSVCGIFVTQLGLGGEDPAILLRDMADELERRALRQTDGGEA